MWYTNWQNNRFDYSNLSGLEKKIIADPLSDTEVAEEIDASKIIKKLLDTEKSHYKQHDEFTQQFKQLAIKIKGDLDKVECALKDDVQNAWQVLKNQSFIYVLNEYVVCEVSKLCQELIEKYQSYIHALQPNSLEKISRGSVTQVSEQSESVDKWPNPFIWNSFYKTQEDVPLQISIPLEYIDTKQVLDLLERWYSDLRFDSTSCLRDRIALPPAGVVQELDTEQVTDMINKAIDIFESLFLNEPHVQENLQHWQSSIVANELIRKLGVEATLVTMKRQMHNDLDFLNTLPLAFANQLIQQLEL